MEVNHGVDDLDTPQYQRGLDQGAQRLQLDLHSLDLRHRVLRFPGWSPHREPGQRNGRMARPDMHLERPGDADSAAKVRARGALDGPLEQVPVDESQAQYRDEHQ